MAALLQKGYSTMFHTIQETSTAGSDTDPELDQSDYNSDDNDHDEATQTNPLNFDHFEESDEELKEEAKASVMARNKNVADVDTQTRGRTPEDALLNGSNDLQNDVPNSQDRGGSIAGNSEHLDSRNMDNENEDDNMSNGGGQIPPAQNNARPDTSNSIQSDERPPNSIKESPTANKSPSKSQRRRSSAAGNLKSLQEEDESMYT